MFEYVPSDDIPTSHGVGYIPITQLILSFRPFTLELTMKNTQKNVIKKINTDNNDSSSTRIKTQL